VLEGAARAEPNILRWEEDTGFEADRLRSIFSSGMFLAGVRREVVAGGREAGEAAAASGEDEEEWTNGSDLGAGLAAFFVSGAVPALGGGVGLVLARRSRRTEIRGLVSFFSFVALLTFFSLSSVSLVGSTDGVGTIPAGFMS